MCVTMYHSMYFVYLQSSGAGGGSGGSLWADCQHFYGNGFLNANGGSRHGSGSGGGGAGGLITVNYVSGRFQSDQTAAYGGLGFENGGPGIVYLQGSQPYHRNLRIDNKQRPAVVSQLIICMIKSGCRVA